MGKRIGEALIEKGLITPAQLEVALKNQLILGGHLGTCLLELGFVVEDQLGRTLSEVLQVPYAPPSLLESIHEGLARALPKRLVVEYRAVPIELKEHTLHVAMVDPKDLLALDALAFGSGHKIAPWIAPEVRIVEAMERHYDVQRSLRYIAIARSIDPVSKELSREAGSPSMALGETYSSGTAENVDPSQLGSEFGYGRSWVEIAEEICGTEPPESGGVPAAVHPQGTGDDAPEAAGSLAGASERLCAANDKDDIGRAVMDYASATMARSVLLAVKGEDAVVWTTSGFSPPPGGTSSLRFPIQGAGVFDLLLGNEHYRGPLAGGPGLRTVYAALGAPAPAEVFLAPVHLNDRLVALLLGDGGPSGRVHGATQDYLRLVRMLALSLSLLLLKKKIRAVESFASPGGQAAWPRIIVAGSEPPPPSPRAERRT
ncbi:MAG: hypothetical protein LAO51_02655 [Acidobacteriia bacterium]|nr:hypothetical protein [Terriglobia bacterium]